MKKFNLSLVAVLAMSTFAVAGGDIAPVEPMVETPMVEESTPGAFYVGLGYGAANVDSSWAYTPPVMETAMSAKLFDVASGSYDSDYDTIMLQAGYKFNPYIAVEGRYGFDLDEDLEDFVNSVMKSCSSLLSIDNKYPPAWLHFR